MSSKLSQIRPQTPILLLDELFQKVYEAHD